MVNKEIKRLKLDNKRKSYDNDFLDTINKNRISNREIEKDEEVRRKNLNRNNAVLVISVKKDDKTIRLNRYIKLPIECYDLEKIKEDVALLNGVSIINVVVVENLIRLE